MSSLASRPPVAATRFTLPRDATGPPSFAELRAREFWRLDAAGEAYLDFTGTALYAESQVQEHLALLRASVLGNPHSESPSSLRSTDHIETIRALTLDLLDADPDDYAVILTANASGAMRIVGESFTFVPRSPLILSADNHNSVNGIREYARARGVATEYVPLDGELRLRDPDAALHRVNGRGPGLFAFPAQSNFSGVQHPLELVGIAHERGYRVLLDAAAFVPTNALSLRRVPADFVAVSYYKIFGYPSGIGALIARRDALAALRRPWFAGGTIDFVSTQNDMHRLKQSAAAFEDGTPNFLAASALVPGFALLEAIGIDAVHRHVMRLTMIMLQRLAALRRSTGEPAVSIYGPPGVDGRGATVAFNLVGADGHVIPFADVEARARTSGISIRGGCFCNPGASEYAFGFPATRARECFEELGPDEFTIPRFSACMPGVPIGAVRASLGIPSNDADVERLIDLIATITNSE